MKKWHMKKRVVKHRTSVSRETPSPIIVSYGGDCADLIRVETTAGSTHTAATARVPVARMVVQARVARMSAQAESCTDEPRACALMDECFVLERTHGCMGKSEAALRAND